MSSLSMTEEEIKQQTLDHWRTYFPKQWRKMNKEKAEKLALKYAKATKKDMENLQAIVPGMSDYEAWTETRQNRCITAWCPDPNEEPGLDQEPEDSEEARQKQMMSDAMKEIRSKSL